MPDITLQYVLEIIGKRIDDLQSEVRNYHQSFINFEEGKLSVLIEKVAKLEKDNWLLTRIVYGACGVILLAVLTALIYLVVKR